MIIRKGPRYCLVCTGSMVPATEWGAWTWAFGDCLKCQHFGMTVEVEDVDLVVARIKRPAEEQGNLFS